MIDGIQDIIDYDREKPFGDFLDHDGIFQELWGYDRLFSPFIFWGVACYQQQLDTPVQSPPVGH